MNESQKIGFGIILGFVLLGALFYVAFNKPEKDKYEVVLETELVTLRYYSINSFVAYIENLPQTAKREVFSWMQTTAKLKIENICDATVIFELADTITDREKELFDPEFEACKF